MTTLLGIKFISGLVCFAHFASDTSHFLLAPQLSDTSHFLLAQQLALCQAAIPHSEPVCQHCLFVPLHWVSILFPLGSRSIEAARTTFWKFLGGHRDTKTTLARDMEFAVHM